MRTLLTPTTEVDTACAINYDLVWAAPAAAATEAAGPPRKAKAAPRKGSKAKGPICQKTQATAANEEQESDSDLFRSTCVHCW